MNPFVKADLLHPTFAGKSRAWQTKENTSNDEVKKKKAETLFSRKRHAAKKEGSAVC
jgi:hypothetical protein